MTSVLIFLAVWSVVAAAIAPLISVALFGRRRK